MMNRFVAHAASTLLALFVVGFADAQAAITSKDDWDTAFASRFGDGSDIGTLLPQDGFYDDTKARFAWHGNYWVRAFVTMAETFDDPSYLDKAVDLIDYMFRYRDDERAARGELDILDEPYYDAPPFYLNNHDQVMPGWRRVLSDGRRQILVLDDGQVTNGIMRFVRLVYENPKYEAYQVKAQEYLSRVIETVDAHTESYIFNRYSRVPGSYYWPKPDGTGFWSNPVPYNQEATMGITLLLLDDVLGGGTEYGLLAEGLVNYWLNYVHLQSNGSYTWDYRPYDEPFRMEDIAHGHIDVGFLLLAYRYSIGDLTAEDMVGLVKTWVQNVYLGNGELAANVDGSGVSDARKTYYAGLDWIDLAEFDQIILRIAMKIYNKHYKTLIWARPFLGWAEILRVRSSIALGKSSSPRR